MTEIARRAFRQQIRQGFRRRAREKAGVGERQPADLIDHRGAHIRIVVAEARNRGAPRCVEVALALGIDNVKPFAAHRHRQVGAERTAEGAGGGGGHGGGATGGKIRHGGGRVRARAHPDNPRLVWIACRGI